MKKILLYIVSALLGIVVALVLFWPRVNPNELYLRLEKRDDLLVNFLKDYQVNDTLKVDVVVIAPKDTTRWIPLLVEMKIPEFIINKLKEGHSPVYMHKSIKYHPEQITSSAENYDIVFFSFQSRTIVVFDIKSDKDGFAILSKKIDEAFPD